MTDFLPRGRRWATIAVTSQLLESLLNLPDDAQIVRFMLDPMRDAVIFAVASERFAEVPLGMHAPELLAEISVQPTDDGGFTRTVRWPELGDAHAETKLPPIDTRGIDDDRG